LFRRVWILGFAILICSVANHSMAGSVSSFQGGVHFVGDIEEGDHAKIINALQNSNQKTLYLNSDGGVVTEAIQIGEDLRALGVETRLGKFSRCASACVLIFAGGVIRSAHSTSEIFVHMGSGIFNAEALAKFEEAYQEFGTAGSAVLASFFEQQAALMTLAQVQYLLKCGVSIRFLEVASEVHHHDGYKLPKTQAIELNLINS